MRKIFLSLLLMLNGITLYAANPGETCYMAIPLGKDFSTSVQSGSVVWYTAWTFDLPLTVTFTPENGSSDPAPIVEMDFSCLSGYYTDSILCSLFCKTSGSSGISFDLPHKPNLKSKTLDDGTFVYYLSLGKSYRDLLLQVGISYNVQVFVKVTYRSSGTIQIAPDNLFSNCVDSAKFMKFGDTVQVAALDTQRHVVVPYVQWQEDTVIYKWTGTTPCYLAVANTCDFDPTDNTDENLIQYTLSPIQPGDSLKVKAEDLYDWVHNPSYPNEAGMYFAKFYSQEPGIMKVVKAPQSLPDGDATLLRYGMTYPINANEQALFAIPRSWNVDVKFTTPTEHIFKMVISKTASFASADTIELYSFQLAKEGRWQGILAAEMKNLWSGIPSSQLYLYIKFLCAEATTITPERWNVSECYQNAANYNIVPGQSITVTRNSTQVYRLSYPQWLGGDMTISFSLTSNCYVYLADTCGMAINHPEDSYWLYKAETKKNSPLVIPADTIAKWADKIDDEGSIYAIFNNNALSGTRKVTLSSNAPEPSDPTYPAATIAVECNDQKQPVVRVSESQTIIITDTNGAEQTRWNAQVGETHVLSLPAGTYVLSGKNDTITLNL